MKLSEYLKDRRKTILFLICAVLSIQILLLVYQMDIIIRLYILLIVPVCYGVGTAMEYLREKRFYEDMLGKLEQLEEKYLIVETVPTPQFLGARIMKDVLRDTNKSMLEHVNQYKQNQEEYKEYIELWIHEIKLPLATSHMIIENNPSSVTKSIKEELLEMEGLVEQALFYARSNTVEKDYCITKTNLKDMVHDVIKQNKQTCIESKIRIQTENIDQKIYTDPKWIQFILNQIVQNSIKYRKEADAEIAFIAKKNKENVILQIRDNGIGIREAEIGRVWDKGFTGSNGRIGKKSTGLGLYLCKKLGDKLGLGIQIFSKESEGTSVEIAFPMDSHFEM